jgi:CRP-like cAMP-binding protein
VLSAVAVEPGPVDLAQLDGVEHEHSPLFGAVVVEGLLTGEVSLDGRHATALLGPGDLLVHDDQPDRMAPSWSVAAVRRSRLALLDDRFLTVSGRWPQVAARLLMAAGSQSRRAMEHEAISHLPRVEDRLLAVLGSAGDRWGRAHDDGVALDLPPPHEALARVVGARRATVMLAMRELGDRELVQRRNGGLVLRRAPSSVARVDELATRFLDAPRLDDLIANALDGAISFLDADFGNVQIYDPQEKVLRIAAQQGFGEEFLDYFDEVHFDDGAVCGRAAGGAQVVVPDVNADAGFAPHRDIAEASGFRGVQSTPLIDGSGRLQGVMSTHFRRVHRPQREQLRVLSTYAEVLADAMSASSAAR